MLCRWDSHFNGPGPGSDDGAGFADEGALLVAKRQGAHGGAMLEQIFIVRSATHPSSPVAIPALFD